MKTFLFSLSLITIVNLPLFSQPTIDTKKFGEFNEGLMSVRVGENWGFIDTTGKLVIEPQFENTFYEPFFRDGVAVIQMVKGGDFGAIDKTGKTVVPCKFYRLTPFSDGVAVVYKPADAGNANTRAHCKIVSKTGMIVNDSTINDYSLQTRFSEGLSYYREKSTYGYLDTKGNIAIPNIFDDVRDFSDGMAAVYTKKGWTFTDKSGKTIDNFYYRTEPGAFHDGIATFTNNEGKKGAIDKSGKIVVQPKYEQLATFEKGFSTGKYTDETTWETVFEILDANGKVIRRLSPKDDKGKYYTLNSGFSEGLAIICEGFSNYGFIDTKGKIVIDLNFNGVEKFTNGRAYAEFTDKKTNKESKGFIDKKGKFVFYLNTD